MDFTCIGNSQEKNTFERITLITKFEVCHKATIIKFGISMKIDIQIVEENAQKQTQIRKVS